MAGSELSQRAGSTDQAASAPAPFVPACDGGKDPFAIRDGDGITMPVLLSSVAPPTMAGPMVTVKDPAAGRTVGPTLFDACTANM